MSYVLDALRHRIAEVAEVYIAPMFKPGVRVTIIVRRPSDNEQDVLVSNDNLEDVVALVTRRVAGGSGAR